MFATHTEPNPTATPDAPAPTATVSVTEPVAGSTRDTVSSTWLETQTPRSPTATSFGANGRGTVAVSSPLDESMRQSVRSSGSPITHTAPSATATLEKYASDPSSAGGAMKRGFASAAVTTSRRLTLLSAPASQTSGSSAPMAADPWEKPPLGPMTFSSRPVAPSITVMFASCGPFTTKARVDVTARSVGSP